MATVKAIVLKHHKKEDGTVMIAMRLTISGILGPLGGIYDTAQRGHNILHI
jgi:hypothetical protein